MSLVSQMLQHKIHKTMKVVSHNTCMQELNKSLFASSIQVAIFSISSVTVSFVLLPNYEPFLSTRLSGSEYVCDLWSVDVQNKEN